MKTFDFKVSVQGGLTI